MIDDYCSLTFCPAFHACALSARENVPRRRVKLLFSYFYSSLFITLKIKVVVANKLICYNNYNCVIFVICLTTTNIIIIITIVIHGL